MPDKCQRAIEAAASILSEETCDEGAFAELDVGDGALVWVPEDALEYSTSSPEGEEEVQEAIESCMKGDWASNWAREVVGHGAPKEVVEETKRKLCEGLYD